MVNNINKALVLRIEELLKLKGMTRYRLALKSGLPHSTLKNIMQCTIKDNRLSTVIMLSIGFDMTVSEFLDSPLFYEENLEF